MIELFKFSSLWVVYSSHNSHGHIYSIFSVFISAFIRPEQYALKTRHPNRLCDFSDERLAGIK